MFNRLRKNSMWQRMFAFMSVMLLLVLYGKYAQAQESVCAEVKIVIEQKVSLERQAFDAKMVIRNGLSSKLEDVEVKLFFWDKNNEAVIATDDANAEDARFFYRIDSLNGIDAIDGGTVTESSSAEIHWLIIPTAGATSKGDELYYVGVSVTYTLNGKTSTVDVTPDYVVVKPLPSLILDYFLTKDVYGDDPFTPEVEVLVPFVLGVRISNSGEGTSYKTGIESAQPKIVENAQNLLVDFEILGGYVSDEHAGKSLLL